MKTAYAKASILWKARIGALHSRNNILSDGPNLYVGTCGSEWNVTDRNDGVHRLDAATGSQIWFRATSADVNEMLLIGSELIVPTDVGDVFVLDSHTGDVMHRMNVGSAVLGKPVVVSKEPLWAVLFAAVDGSVYLLRKNEASPSRVGAVPGPILAPIVAIDESTFLISSGLGDILIGSLRDGRLSTHFLARVPSGQYGGPTSIYAAPLIDNGVVYVSYARETYDDLPPIVSFDLTSGNLLWTGGPVKGQDFGNGRTTPALVDGQLVFACAYSDSLHMLSPVDGRHIGSVILGQSVFQQWSGPVAIGPYHVALGRVDGVCSVVDLRAGALASSVSLATPEAEALLGTEGETYALLPGEPAPLGAICGTPLVHDGALIVGTTAGDVARVDLRFEKVLTN